MTDNFGNGVSRVLPAEQTQYDQVIFQWDKPPLESEFNLIQQVEGLKLRTAIQSGMPSGWLGNSTGTSEVWETNPLWSNWFSLKGPAWANVNGWLIPVTGTRTGTPPGLPNNDAFNRILLDPPPSSSGETRQDFVFLEVWKARIPPNPSTLNKPSAGSVYRYGNLEGGWDYLADDLQDPDIGEETSQRVQIQYRIRVVTSLTGLAQYPDGFDPAVVKAQGAASSPTSYTFTNMATTLGDPGLWRAGDGTSNTLGTVDGYVYAIPMAVVFRRNSVGWDGDPGQNLAGGLTRNPTAVDRTGAKTWTAQGALAADMTATATQASLVSVADCPLPTAPASAMYCQIGDEVVLYRSITGTTMTITARGQLGTSAEPHKAGQQVKLVSGRPDGLYADQVAKQDILDVRHIVNPNGFNYRSLLAGGLDNLLRGKLKTDWKRSGGGTAGTTILYQDKISVGAAAMGVTKLDAPDGIRQVWSDAVVTQSADLILKPYSVPGETGSCLATWDLIGVRANHACTVADQWAPGDTITLPLASLGEGMPGADIDQLKWLVDDWAISLRIDGELNPSTRDTTYGYTAAIVGSDLVITLGALFLGIVRQLFLKVTYQIGPGRGLSRKPDAVHAVHLLNTSPQGYVLRNPRNEPSGELPQTVSWAPTWSRFRKAMWANLLPSTAASYVDMGSKTVILTPWRSVALPPQIKTQDGTSLNGGAGLMPGGDPLSLFSSASGDPSAATKNIYIQIPRNLLPTWGEVKVPILRQDTGVFSEGVNFGILARKGPSTGVGPGEANYVVRKQVFDTRAPYNITGNNGIRKFTDTTGLGRQGLEFPPFYGIARLFAVYEAADYLNGSAYDDDSLAPRTGYATNLLRQDLQGATFWIEPGTNGDSTFVLNADCLDLSKTSLANFAAGEYVVEASIFGFDRGAFTSDQDPRIVLAVHRPESNSLASRTENVQEGDNTVTLTSPTLVIPAPASTDESFGVTFSRTVYQGDPLGTQLNHTDIGYLPGPLTSSQAYQIASTSLDQANLTRPRQKVLEVLDAMGFITSLGTGRMSGDSPDTGVSTDHPLSRIGYEDRTNYPPTSSTAARPALLQDALVGPDVSEDIGTSLLGCTERLPLGALWRDKDFVGTAPQMGQTGLFYTPVPGSGVGMASISVPQPLQETFEEAVQTADVGSGAPGQLMVHVDGEQGNYGLLTNFRTTRGGSAFMASGRPGGELRSSYGDSNGGNPGTGVITGTAYLVRVSPFTSGLTTLTNGGELMMLIATTAQKLTQYAVRLETLVGTNGTGEGDSAVDLYRLPGRPLERDNVRLTLDPSQIILTRPVA